MRGEYTLAGFLDIEEPSILLPLLLLKIHLGGAVYHPHVG